MLNDQLRSWEMRDRHNQVQQLAVLIEEHAARMTFEEIVREGIDPLFLRENNIDVETAVSVFAKAERRVEQALLIPDEEGKTSVHISNVLGPVNVGGKNVRQSQSIAIGDSSALLATLGALGFSSGEAEAQLREVRQLGTGAKKSDVKKLALRVARRASEIAEKVGVGVLAGAIAKAYLLYLGIS